MIRNYWLQPMIWVIYISIEKIIIGNTQPAPDVPGTSPEGPNVQDLQVTFRGLSGDQYRNW